MEDMSGRKGSGAHFDFELFDGMREAGIGHQTLGTRPNDGRLSEVNMEAHLVYTLCSADAIYTYFGIGGNGMLDAGSATPSMMGAEGNVDHPPSKRRRSDD